MAKLKDGFYKLTASSIGSDLLVLLAGGGAKPISDFALADGTNATGTWSIDISGNAKTATTATTASKLSTVSKTAWGLTYWTSGGVPTSISGDMTGVGNINMTGSINTVLKATTSLGAALLNIAEVTADTNYVHLYVSSLNSIAATTRALVLQNGYGNVGIGTPTPGYKLHVVGTTFSTGFVKAGSSDSYVLLGGGGHKSISSFQTTYDGRYVLKAGDTMTGPLTISTSNWGNLLVLNRVNNGENWGPSIIFKFDGTHNGSLTMLSNLLYIGDNGGVRYKAWHEGNDGSGSGLDADLLDGKLASDFLLAGNYLIDHGMSTSRPNGTTFTLPVGANGVSMRSKATSGTDIGIFLLTDDNAFICNSSDNSYLFATFDTDKTADFSSPSNAAFAVLSDHVGAYMKGSLTVDNNIVIGGSYIFTPTAGSMIGTRYSATDTTLYNRIKINAGTGGILYNSGTWTSGVHAAHQFLTGGSSSEELVRMVIMNITGNVGIGDSNPAYKLEVAGSICGTVIYANRDGSATAGGVSLYSNSDPMTYGIAFRGTGTYGTHGYVTAANDWATYLTMSDTANRGWIFRRGSTNVASIAGSGNMAIGQNLEFSNGAHIATNRTTDYHYSSLSFSIGNNSKNIGMYSGPEGEAGGVVVSPDGCLIYNSSDSGFNLDIHDKDLGGDLTAETTRTFAILQSSYYAWSRGGFKKNGSDDTYVLLGGGGHKLESNLSVSSARTASRATTANMISHSTYYYSGNVMKNNTSADTIFGTDATANYLFPSFMESHPIFNNYADVINFTGYCKWGGTQLATEYNAINPRVAIRKYNQSRSNWGDWTELLSNKNGVRWGGWNGTFEANTPASAVKSRFTASYMPDGNLLTYNTAGNEYTLLMTCRPDMLHGSALKWGYPDRYIRILRFINGTAQTTDWEKIAAGYADSAGYATNASYYTLGPSSTFTNVWNCNTPDRIVYSDYGSSGRNVSNAPAGWSYGTLLELGHMNYRGQNANLNLQLMWDVAHGTTNGGTLWFRGNCSTYKWAKNWCKVLSDQNYSSYALPLSGGWMDKDATIYFKNPAGGTSPYAGIGYRTSVNGTMHCTSAANASGAFYIFSNGYDSANDFGGIAIDNEGVTVFGAGDPGNNFTGVFRVLNEDNPGDGPLFIVTKASGATVKYNMYAAHFYESSDQQLKTNIQEILNSDKMPIIKEFDWKEDGSHSYGLIAQELEEQGYSELVSTKDDGYKTVNYSAALSLIVGKLQVKIKELEEEIEILKKKN